MADIQESDKKKKERTIKRIQRPLQIKMVLGLKGDN